VKSWLIILLSLTSVACSPSNDAPADASEPDLAEIVGRITSTPNRVSWIIPLPDEADEKEFNQLEQTIADFLRNNPLGSSEHFWDGAIYLNMSLSDSSSASLMPKLRPAVQIGILAVEMLYYPRIPGSPYSGDMLEGVVGHRSSADFLYGVVYSPSLTADRTSHLISRPERVTSKRNIQGGLLMEGMRARGALLAGKDAFVFAHFYGHGIQDGYGHTALVVPAHELSNATYTGLSADSLMTLESALETFLDGAVGLPEDFARAIGKPEKAAYLTQSRQQEDLSLMSGPKKKKARLGITMIMETCSTTVISNPKGDKGRKARFAANGTQRSMLRTVKRDWLTEFEAYANVKVDLEVSLVVVSEPGKQLDVSIDHNGMDVILQVKRANVRPDGRVEKLNPLNYGVLAARIPLFIEESIYAAGRAKAVYRVSDISSDIAYYKERYLADNAAYRSVNDERVEVSDFAYWDRMASRHSTKRAQPESMAIVRPEYAATYVLFAPGISPGTSRFQVELDWKEAVRSTQGE